MREASYLLATFALCASWSGGVYAQDAPPHYTVAPGLFDQTKPDLGLQRAPGVWPTGFQSGAGGYTEYILSKDGQRWSKPRRVMGRAEPVEGIIEQDPHLLPGGRLVTAFHTRPGMIVAPFYTDDALGIRGWMRGQMPLLPNDGNVSRELEPSLFLRVADDCAVMVFRDQESSFRQLASESCDRGASWSLPALTDMPDSRAKQSAGNLPTGGFSRERAAGFAFADSADHHPQCGRAPLRSFIPAARRLRPAAAA